MINQPVIWFSRFACVIFASTVLLGFSSHAFAWGKDGHTTVGILAINQLQPDALHELEKIMGPLDKAAMEEACNWPDVIRETEDGEWSSPLHYINIPRGNELYSIDRDCPLQPEDLKHPERPQRFCATEAVKHFAIVLGNHNAPKQQRKESLNWLCHLVGDLHQPLHAGFADDRGGNNHEIVFNDEEMNLHGLWDSSLINQHAGSWQYLVGLLVPLSPVQADSNWSAEMVDKWTNRSHKLTEHTVYPPTHIIDTNYEEKSWERIQQQIPLAASNLALIINTQLQQNN